MRKKQPNRYFQRQPDEILHEKTWTWLRKGNLKREIESLPIAAQRNVIRTNYIKEKIDNMLQNALVVYMVTMTNRSIT